MNASFCLKRSVVLRAIDIFFDPVDVFLAIWVQRFAFADPMTLFHE